MKKIVNIGMVIILILITSGMQAQRNIESRLDYLKTALNLTDDQTTQLEEIFESRKDKMLELRDQDFENREERMQAMKAQREAVHQEIESVLSGEQIVKFKEIRGQRKDRGPRGPHGKRFGERPMMKDGQGKALRDEIRAYKDEYILPVMKVQRAKLESKITAENQQLIAEMRVEAQKKREMAMKRFERKAGKGHKQKRDFRPRGRDGEKGSKGTCEPGEGGFRGTKGTRPNDGRFEQMKGLVEKYRDDIQPLLDEVSGEQEKWKKDVENIVEKYVEADASGRMKERFQKMKDRHADRMAKMKMGMFLLLDPNAPVANTTESSQVASFSVYPNPAVSQTTLEYELLEEGKILLELRDAGGNLLKTLENTKKEAGRHRLNIDLQDYKTNIYYIVIKDKNGIAKTKNLVRAK